jgi:hypothetical protein
MQVAMRRIGFALLSVTTAATMAAVVGVLATRAIMWLA